MVERSGLAEASKLVRRTTLANDPALVEEINEIISSDGYDAAVSNLMNRGIDTSIIPYSYNDPFDQVREYHSTWVDKILNGSNPLQEKMTLFWHEILTSSRNAAGGKYGTVAQQMNLFRTHALGSFSDLLFEFVKDPLLMRYLNANQNVVKRPNENLARELMELFTTGPGPYNEDDVRNVALAISGWRLENETGRVFYNPKLGSAQSFSFLGETRVWDLDSVVRKLLDHPQTANRLAQLLWDDIVGSGEAPSSLGRNWHDRGYDNRWLVTEIVSSDEFRESGHYVRPKSGFEYYMTLARILGFDPRDLYRARNLGHMPWEPPNVAGWPGGDRWLDVGSSLSRLQSLAFDFKTVEGGTTARTEETLDRCAIFEVSERTLQAINDVDKEPDLGEPGLAQLRWWVALSSPEANLV